MKTTPLASSTPQQVSSKSAVKPKETPVQPVPKSSQTPPPTNKTKQAAAKETKPTVFTGWDSMMASSFGKNAVSGVAKDPLEKSEKAKNDSKAEA